MLKFFVGFMLGFMVWCSAAHAKPHGWDPNSPVAKWVSGLCQPGKPQPCSYVESCCDKGDMYPIVIEQDAIGESGDDRGIARITDGSAIEYPDGTTRPPLPTGMTFRFAKSQVNPLRDGNPTTTAWVFLYSYGDGKIARIYCVIQIPPGM